MTKTYRISEEQREELLDRIDNYAILDREANEAMQAAALRRGSIEGGQAALDKRNASHAAMIAFLDALAVPDCPPAGAKFKVGDRVAFRSGIQSCTRPVIGIAYDIGGVGCPNLVAESELETLAERAARLRQEAAACEAEAEKGSKDASH